MNTETEHDTRLHCRLLAVIAELNKLTLEVGELMGKLEKATPSEETRH